MRLNLALFFARPDAEGGHLIRATPGCKPSTARNASHDPVWSYRNNGPPLTAWLAIQAAAVTLVIMHVTPSILALWNLNAVHEARQRQRTETTFIYDTRKLVNWKFAFRATAR